MSNITDHMKLIRERRRDWMRTAGTTRSIDLGHRIMDDFLEGILPDRMTDQTIEGIQMDRGPGRHPRISEASAGMGALVIALSAEVDGAAGKPKDLVKRYNLRSAEYGHNRNEFSFGDGLVDQDFTWHYAPFVAHEVMKAAVQEELVAPDTLEQMTLHDWAHIFECGWFRDLMHDMALTSNGLYAKHGKESLSEYRTDVPLPLAHLQEISPSVQFDFHTVEDTTTELGETLEHVVAELSPKMRAFLRTKLKEMQSPGCPVARKHFTIPREQADNDPHMRRILEDGLVRELALGERSVRMVQTETPIDRALSLLARSFEVYEDRYGTPLLDTKTGALRHEYYRPLLLPLQRDVTNQIQ